MNVRVKRYQEPNAYESSVEPEDGSWILFVPEGREYPELWVRIKASDDDGNVVEGYISKSMSDAIDSGAWDCGHNIPVRSST